MSSSTTSGGRPASIAAAAARAKIRAAHRAAGEGLGAGGRRSSIVDEVEEDPNKSWAENAKTFLRAVVETVPGSAGGGGGGGGDGGEGPSGGGGARGAFPSSPNVLSSPQAKVKKLANLNALAKMFERRSRRNTDRERSAVGKRTVDADDEESALRMRELLLCLRIPLTSDSVEVRATALRTVRCVITRPEDVADISLVNLHHLIARCIDIDLDNQEERVQAMRLVRKMIFLAPQNVPKAAVRSLMAIAAGDHKETDRLRMVATAVLCELSVTNSDLFIACNGVSVITRTLLDISMARMAEAVLSSLLRLDSAPAVRPKARITLDVVVAPFTEFRYVHDEEPSSRGGDSSAGTARGDREHHHQCAYQAVLSMMRSWSGTIHLANPKIRNAITPLQSLVNTLYLSKPETRKLIINLFTDVLCLRRPSNDADTYAKALDSINPSAFKEKWKLAEGFVVSEGLDILPNLTKTRPNLVDTHRAVLLNILLRAKLPDALVCVIVTSSEPELSVLATVLLGEFLYLAYFLLPRELNMTGHCLPSLLAEVASSDHLRSNRASEAVNALQILHSMKKSGPVANSLFLDQILQDSGCFQNQAFAGDRIHSPHWEQLMLVGTNLDEKAIAIIGESKVLDTKDATAWDWDVVSSLFRNPPTQTLDGSGSSSDVQTVRQFVKRISDFFKPSNNLYAKVELKSKRARYLTKIGCLFCDFLVRSKSAEGERVLDEFVIDIQNEMNLFLSSTAPQDCLFSPTRIATTVCQYYFLFLGRMSRTAEGRAALDRQRLLRCLYELLLHSSNLYLKLIISSLDYGNPEWGSRNIMARALKDGTEYSRLYATRFIGILLRSHTPNIAQWGIGHLVEQLSSSSKIIPWVALDLLAEACDDKMNLEAVICAMKDANTRLDRLGLKGVFLRTQFLASANGFKMLRQTGFLDDQLQRWREEYNDRYVTLVEEMLSDGFSHHQKNEERIYGRRSHEAHVVRDVFIPPHLYGQLAATESGFEALQQDGCLKQMFVLLRSYAGKTSDVEIPVRDLIALRSAIWAICNVSTSPEGASLLERERALPGIVAFAEKSPYYSLRGTSVYALSLVATTRRGTRMLSQYGWCSLRFSRHDKWPVLEEWFANQLVTVNMEYDQMAAANAALYDDDYPVSSPLDLDDDDDDGSVTTREGERSFSFSFSPAVKETSSEPRETRPNSVSGRKRLGDMFRSFSLGKSTSSSSGGDSSMQRRQHRRRRLLFRNSGSLDTGDTSSGGGADTSSSKPTDGACLSEPQSSTAPIATPDAADDLNIKDGDGEREGKVDTVLPRGDSEDATPPKLGSTLTDSTSGVSSASGSLQRRGKVAVQGPIMKLSPIASSTSISTTATHTAPVDGSRRQSKDMDTLPVQAQTNLSSLRSGHRCVSESEAQRGALSTQLLAPGQSITSMSSVGSWTENPGYMTLRSIHSRRRPVLSAEDSTEQADHPGNGQDRDMVRGSAAAQRLWAVKSRSLDSRLRRGRPRPRLPSGIGGLTRYDGTSSLPHRPSVMGPLLEETAENPLLGGQNPRYRGITLPLQMDLLFPEKDGCTDADVLIGAASVRSSQVVKDKVDDWLQSHPSYHGLELHTHDNCLGCFRMEPASGAVGVGGMRSRSGSLQQAAANEAAAGGSMSNQGSPLLMRRLRRGSDGPAAAGGGGGGGGAMGSLLFAEEDHFSFTGSSQSLRSDGAPGATYGFGRYPLAPSDSIMARLMQRKEVLKLISCMNATVGMATAESGLLKLKQRFPGVFHDLCLYSEVSLLLANHSFRLSARRFIQELFLDVQFHELCVEPWRILGLSDNEGGASSAPSASHPHSAGLAAASGNTPGVQLPNFEEENEDEEVNAKSDC